MRTYWCVALYRLVRAASLAHADQKKFSDFKTTAQPETVAGVAATLAAEIKAAQDLDPQLGQPSLRPHYWPIRPKDPDQSFVFVQLW